MTIDLLLPALECCTIAPRGFPDLQQTEYWGFLFFIFSTTAYTNDKLYWYMERAEEDTQQESKLTA